MPILLQAHHLTKIYRRSQLWKSFTTVGVQDLDLTLFEGEIFGLLGQNGAGKTTTLKLILGLLFPTSGEMTLLGKNLPDRWAVQQTGFVPEVPYFPKHLSAREILHLYGILSNVAPREMKEKIEKALQLTRLWDHREKRARECSKGMLQRLSLAQALIHDPKVLILDEPITGLDPLGLTEMRELILNLNSQGKTILFSSHILAEVEKIAHRVGILVGGKLVKVLESKEWTQDGAGSLEKIYVQTIRSSGGSDL
ncbi:MAG: ABC transporter ATP-binding protein [Elusimicrobia bacterium]|nr:ABC transporter ATP-binding protein [Elusimicrobiota bacterium]